jgi:TolB-like protein
VASLVIRLLGGFEVRLAAGQAVSLTGRKTKALLAYLALRPGEACPRDRLTALLWGDRGEQQARSSLRQALSELRKSFGDMDPSPLITLGDSVALDPGAIEVDVVTFERLIAEGGPENLGQAVQLYRGEFLDGLGVRDPAFEAWLGDQQRRLGQLFAEASGRLLAHLEAGGERTRVEPVAKRLLAVDPLQEAAHRALMRTYARSGERNLALRQFQDCEEALRRELGVEPESATLDLYREIVGGSAADDGPGVASLRDSQDGSADTATASVKRPAVAVLPFENLSAEQEQEYFADGMTRELITELGRFSTLAVIAAATMFSYKGRRVAVAEVGRDLDARYVVEGSVQKSGRRIRITAQLTDAQTGQQVWADRFDGDLGDIFDIQDEITRRISGNLYQPLIESAALEARQKPVKSADAYDLYLQAHYHIERPTAAGNVEARRACERVIEIDPGFALAYELLMWTDIHAAWNGWADGPEAALRAAKQNAARGVALDDRDGYLRGAHGLAEVMLGNGERGLAELRAAIEFNPNSATYLALLGGALAYAGRAEEALAMLQQAEHLSPGYHVTCLFLGDAYFVAGRVDEALPYYEHVLNVLPEMNWSRLHLAACHVELGQLEAAREGAARIRASSPNMTITYVKELLSGHDPDAAGRILAAARQAGLPEDT